MFESNTASRIVVMQRTKPMVRFRLVDRGLVDRRALMAVDRISDIVSGMAGLPSGAAWRRWGRHHSPYVNILSQIFIRD